MRYTAQQLKNWDLTRHKDNKPARAENCTTLWQRIKNGWMVVIGCYDVVDWE